jgi:hypothetical protein
MRHARHAVNPRAFLLRGDQSAQCEVEDGAPGFLACGALARSRSAFATAVEGRLPPAVDCMKLFTSVNAGAHAQCPGQWSVRCPANGATTQDDGSPMTAIGSQRPPNATSNGRCRTNSCGNVRRQRAREKVAFLPEPKLESSRGWNSRASLEIKSVAVCRCAHGPATRRSLAFPGLGHPPLPVAT